MGLVLIAEKRDWLRVVVLYGTACRPGYAQDVKHSVNLSVNC